MRRTLVPPIGHPISGIHQLRPTDASAEFTPEKPTIQKRMSYSKPGKPSSTSTFHKSGRHRMEYRGVEQEPAPAPGPSGFPTDIGIQHRLGLRASRASESRLTSGTPPPTTSELEISASSGSSPCQRVPGCRRVCQVPGQHNHILIVTVRKSNAFPHDLVLHVGLLNERLTRACLLDKICKGV